MSETLEQLKARLQKQDEEKEQAFQKSLKEVRAANARWRAEKEAEKRAEEEKRQKLHEELRLKREKEMKDTALRPWLDAGGTEEEFEVEWPEIWREMLKERALGGASQERREASQQNLKAF